MRATLGSTTAALLGLCLAACQRTSTAAPQQAEPVHGEVAPGVAARAASPETRDPASPVPVAETAVNAQERPPAVSDPPASTAGPPSGIIAVKSRRTQGGLDPQTVSNPSISGFAYQINWAEIEQTPANPNWSKLDALFASAESAKKWVRVDVIPGFFAPAWAEQGADTEMFTVAYGLYKGQVLQLPMPWDRAYLSRWFAFLKQLSARYGKSPAFRIVSAAGPTSISDEMTLPHGPGELKLWQRHGYTARRFVDAWRQALSEYASSFPNQYVTLTVGQGIALDDSGRFDPSEPARTRQAVIESASAILGQRFVLMNDDLHAGPNEHDDTDVVREYSGRVLTGLQTRCGSQGPIGSAAMGAAGNPPLALRRSLDLGMAPSRSGQRIGFVEIQEPDALDAELQPVLREYAARLRNR